jgi:peptide/nickel transport system permease protein
MTTGGQTHLEDASAFVVPGPTGSPLVLRSARSPRRQALRRFFRHRLAILGMTLIAVLALVALAAPLVAPYDPTQAHFSDTGLPPGRGYILGTDDLGRDVLSRVIYAARISLSVGLIAVGIYETIGIVLGALSGYFGGIADMTIQRLVDIVMSFPSLIVILVFIILFGPSIYNVMIAIGLLSWPEPTRLVRGQVLQLREVEYVTAARAVGAGDARIILRHLLPGVVSPLIVNATFGVSAAIMTEAALSFLGLGTQPPTPSWGNMLMDAQNLTKLQTMPWLWLPPGLAIVITVLAINFIGDGLRDALDPKQLIR